MMVLSVQAAGGKGRFRTVDAILTGMFCALWAAVNLFLGPLSFQLLRSPVLHDFGVFFTLLLVSWITGRFGTASMAGVIGTALALPLGAPFLIICFVFAAVLFDLIMVACRHRVRAASRSLVVVCIATIVSAYFAGVLIGAFFMSGSQTLEYTITFWGGLHVLGGILALAVTLPLILSLERANVRRLLSDDR